MFGFFKLKIEDFNRGYIQQRNRYRDDGLWNTV